jgi:outer membrane protein TolC
MDLYGKIFLIFLFFFNQTAFALEQKITEETIVKSASQHYPEILSYYEIVNESQGSLLASKGFFDIQLKQSYQDKNRGFYNGKNYDISLEKELGFMGSNVYTGYRKSSGNFPSYEGNKITNSGGEYRAGAKFSLLRNSDIDHNRLKVILAELLLLENKTQLENIKIHIERDATKAYWQWVVNGKIYQIYQQLYQLSISRQNQLEQKLKRGDIAEILVIENKKNILRRKNSLTQAKQKFENSGIYLSLFFRNQDRNPIIPTENQLPQIELKLDHHKIHYDKKDIEQALNNRPEIRILKIKKEEEVNQLKYAKNLFKPELDVDVGVSKDLGNGPRSRSEGNQYTNLNFSVPLQQREAKGEKIKSESKIKSIEYETKLMEEKIIAEIQQIKVKIHAITEMHQNLVEEVRLAELLEHSEREKFKHGASNFFLVNLREQDTANSKALLAEMFEQYQNAIIDYRAAIFTSLVM